MSQAAGKRDRRIIVQRMVVTGQDEAGHDVETPETLATVWARFVPPEAGREPYTASQFAAFVDAEFEVLYRADFLNLDPATHRIVFDGRVYNVLGVVEIERRSLLRFTAKARAEAGAPAA